MATNTQDYADVFKNVFGAFNVDQSAFKAQSERAEKLAAVGLNAMKQSSEISANWGRDTLARLSGVTAAKQDPQAYAKAFSDFASAYAEAANTHLTAYAEVAKKAQADATELLMATGKDMSEDFSAATKNAQAEMTKVGEQVRKQAAAK